MPDDSLTAPTDAPDSTAGACAAPDLYRVNNGRGALLSACGAYRYRLWRLWDDIAPVMVWVMLNPSTADADDDDPTIRKCVGFARAHHHGGIIVVNLFAWRATNPKELPPLPDYIRIGPENDAHIQWAINAPLLATIIGGWGAERFARHRATTVGVNIQARRPMHCFGKSKDGAPKHPLYLPYTTPMERLFR